MSDHGKSAAAKNRKPFWKKWWFWVIIVLTVVAIGGMNGNRTNPTQQATVSAGATAKPKITPKEPTPEAKKNTPTKKSPLQEFKRSFDAQSATPISNISSFVVQDRNSGHYRTEYRLGAYSDATGEHGTIGDISIDMVRYRGSMFRIYATGPRDSVLAVYPALAKSMDPSLTDTDIQALVDKYRQGYVANDLSFADSAKRIESNDFTLQDGNIEAFIDADFSK